MSDKFTVLKERVKRFQKIHLKAIAAFNAFEQLQEFRAPNLLGSKLVQKIAL